MHKIYNPFPQYSASMFFFMFPTLTSIYKVMLRKTFAQLCLLLDQETVFTVIHALLGLLQHVLCGVTIQDLSEVTDAPECLSVGLHNISTAKNALWDCLVSTYFYLSYKIQ